MKYKKVKDRTAAGTKNTLCLRKRVTAMTKSWCQMRANIDFSTSLMSVF